MTLDEVIKNSALFTDEQLDNSNYVNASNRAIALINTECKTLFPSITSVTENYVAMPKDWFFSLLSPYISYTTKMNDSSVGEADRYLEEFYKALNNFKDELGTLVDNYDPNKENNGNGISPDYISENGFGGVYEIDTSNAINVGWFSNDTSGGSW